MGQTEASNRIYDGNLVLDAGTTSISTATSTTMSVASVDLGTGVARGEMVFNYSGLDAASNDELYHIVLQGSDNSGFSSGTEVELASFNLGALEALDSDTDSPAAGQVVLPFSNELHGTTYRYVRGRVVSSGTSPAIDIDQCFLTIKHR